MLAEFWKYHGAGNDFLLADNRDGSLQLTPELIERLCDRHTGFGADGVILLREAAGRDFGMDYFNSDGSGGMMCGNGGRCILAFAADKGVVSGPGPVVFEAPDGEHVGIFTNHCPEKGERTVRLKMRDVVGAEHFPDEDSWFLDTGTRHLVKFVEGLDDYPVFDEGRRLRSDPRFAPVGVNVNFVEAGRDGQASALRIRTFEKGVEDETLACGTGIVASAMAAYSSGIVPASVTGEAVRFGVRAAIAELQVDFVPCGIGAVFAAKDVWLTGPAVFVGRVFVELDRL